MTGAPRAGSAILVLCALAVTVAFGVSRERLGRQRGFNPDELEHLHFSYLIAEGKVAYRDYFDHHAPLLHLIMGVELRRPHLRDNSDPAQAIVAARGLSLAFSLLILVFGGIVVGKGAGAGPALVFVSLVCGSSNFIGKSLEFRPDVPAALLLVLATAFYARNHKFFSGLSAGLALLFTPKAVFAACALALTELFSRWRTSDVWRAMGLFSLGTAVPLLALGTWLFAESALASAFRFVVLEASRWNGPSPWPFLLEFLRNDWVLSAGFMAAFVSTLHRWPAEGPLSKACLVATLGGLGGILVVPYPSRHHLLLTLPACAALVALTWGGVARRIAPEGGRNTILHLVLAVVILGAGYSDNIRAFSRGNTGAIVAMEQIARNTHPEETVLDGFSGYAPLRPHGTFFPFLHRDVRALREKMEPPTLLEALRSGRLFPKFALMNHYLREGVEPGVWEFLETNYTPLDEDPTVRVRLFDNGLGFWSDTASRSLAPSNRREPHALVLGGWSGVRVVEGRLGRWTLPGEPSVLLIPVQQAGSYDLGIDVLAVGAVSLSVSFEGKPIDAVDLSAGEGTAVIPIPAWRSGLNRVAISTSSAGKNCFVSSVRLRARPVGGP